MADGDNAGVTLRQVRLGNAVFKFDLATVNEDVRTLQTAMNLYGYNCNGMDGKYGKSTEGAIKDFQYRRGLTVTGELNQATLSRFESWSGTLRNDADRQVSDITKVENGLNYYDVGDTHLNIKVYVCDNLVRHGYNCTLTVSYDNALKQVVQAFQRDKGLIPDGRVGQKTYAALKDFIADSDWFTSEGVVQLTAGKLARAGFEGVILSSRMVFYLNTMLNNYSINTPRKVRHFLAQCMKETQFGNFLVESGYVPGDTVPNFPNMRMPYKPFYGAGFLHLTGLDNYRDFKNYLNNNDSQILAPVEYATQYVANIYPGESADWFWSVEKNLNNVIDWSSDDEEGICTELTRRISGSTETASERFTYFRRISTVLI